MAAENESGPTSGWKGLRDGAARLSLPIFATVVSAVLVANFVSSRQDAQHLQRERDLQTKATIANDMSETAVSLIFAAETRTKALASSRKSPSSSDAASRSLADLYASSAFIRAKLEAYYKDQSLATRWKRYTNALGAFLELGAEPSAFEPPGALVQEIRRGFGGDGNSTAALEKVHFNVLEKPVTDATAFAYLQNYRQLGDVLIDRGAELTREALN
jgi:hypothetical protein